MSTKHSIMGGAVTLELKQRTRGTRIEKDRLVRELSPVDDPVMRDELITACFIVANTESIETVGDAPAAQQIAQWWESVQGDPPDVWAKALVLDVWEGFLDYWWDAYTKTERHQVSLAEAAPNLLTEAQKTDPKSRKPAGKSGKS